MLQSRFHLNVAASASASASLLTCWHACAQLVEEKSDWWKGYRLQDPSKQQGSFPKTLVKKMSKDALLRKGYS
jgi:hypothetical protein